MENSEVIKSIHEDIRYWLIRTMGGDYYRNFVGEGFIAIGYNNIKIEDIKYLSSKDHDAKEELKNILAVRNEKMKNTSYPASQILRFFREIQKGDIVVVPSSCSNRVSFGVVDSDVYEEYKNLIGDDKCPFIKRRRVIWYKEKEQIRRKLNPNLQLMFNSRHIISNVTDYAPYIDSVINDFYIKGGETHLVLRINRQEDVNINDFFVLNKIFDLVDGFCEEFDMNLGPRDVVMKIQMESPGWLRFISNKTLWLLVFGSIIVGINGGGLEYNGTNCHFSLSTDGLINSISSYLDRKMDREMKNSIKNSLDSLELGTPNDLKEVINLLQEQNSIRKKY